MSLFAPPVAMLMPFPFGKGGIISSRDNIQAVRVPEGVLRAEGGRKEGRRHLNQGLSRRLSILLSRP